MAYMRESLGGILGGRTEIREWEVSPFVSYLFIILVAKEKTCDNHKPFFSSEFLTMVSFTGFVLPGSACSRLFDSLCVIPSRLLPLIPTISSPG